MLLLLAPILAGTRSFSPCSRRSSATPALPSAISAEARAEAVQNVICNTWAALVALAKRGKLDLAYPTVLARYGIKQTRDHRIVGGHLAIKDVLSKYCQQKKGVVVERLDKFDEDENQWGEAIVEDKTSGPADIARVRLDFDAWLKQLPRRNRRLAEFLALGNRTKDAAQKFRMSEGRISQVRRELAESWRTFVGDEPVPEAA